MTHAGLHRQCGRRCARRRRCDPAADPGAGAGIAAQSMFDLGRTFLATVERSPDALAIVDGGRRLTYAEWYGEISGIAAGLAESRAQARRPARGDPAEPAGDGEPPLGLPVSRNRRDPAQLADQGRRDRLLPRRFRGCARSCSTAVAAEAVAGSAAARRSAAHRDRRRGRHGPLRGLARRPAAPSRRKPTPRICRCCSTPRARPGGPRACRAGTVPSAPRRSPMSRRTSTAAASARSGSCRSITRWGCARCLAMALVDGAFVCLPRFDPAAALAADRARAGDATSIWCRRSITI